MITLKKNDKLIVIIAVVVLVIAAVGIATYSSPDDENGTGDVGNSGMKTFNVEWDLMYDSLPAVSDYVGKRSIYEETFTISTGNLKNVIFNLSWSDDKTFLGRFGRDTLTIEVTGPDGSVYEESGKSGNIGLTIDYDGISQMADTIEAESEDEAEWQLNEKETKEFVVKVGVNIGEIRILRKIRDKGNSFDLDISYEYYEASIVGEIKGTGSNDPLDDFRDEEYIPPLSLILNTGSARYI